jgi:lipopolysaccharide export system protein LptA
VFHRVPDPLMAGGCGPDSVLSSEGRDRGRGGTRPYRVGLWTAWVIFGCCVPVWCPAQQFGTAKGFKAAEYFPSPHDSQIQSLLEASKVQSLVEQRFLLSDVTLQTFATSGARELIIKTPQCLYDPGTKTASSPGALRVVTADTNFWIEGEGFLFSQAHSSLVISNRVRTLINSASLDAPAESQTRNGAADKQGPPLEIQSRTFSYSGESGEGVYELDVRAAQTNQLSLASQKLTFLLPMKARQLQSLRAEKDVVIDYASLHATGQTTVYSADTGLIKILGDPAWRSEQREGRGDELKVDRTNKVFRADGHAWVRMPARGLSLTGLMSGPGTQAAGPDPGSNHWVEVSSGYHEFRTNQAEFGKQVSVTERVDDRERGTMDCGLLEIAYSGTNQLDSLVAQEQVVMKEGTNTLSGGKAVYHSKDGWLTLSGHPAWSSGERSGKGELIRINTRTNEMVVRGNASMRLPGRELTQAADARGPLPTPRAAGKPTNEWAEVFCEEYTLRPDGVQFRGGVYASHPRMNWACETLTVRLPGAGGQGQSILAEQGVTFDMLDSKGQKMHGTADKAIYTYSVSGGRTNDLLELTGNPATLQTAATTNRNKVILLDRANNTLRNVGNYSISSSVQRADTNALVLPKMFPGK